MSRENFIEAKFYLDRIGILRVAQDSYMTPKKLGTNYVVKSPASEDKHWSCILRPQTNSFVDFSNAGYGGDIIRFVSYVKGCNNWQSLQLLRDFYELPIGEKGTREDIRRKIQLQKQEEERKEARRQEFFSALLSCIYDLKKQENKLKSVLDSLELSGDDWITIRSWLSEVTWKLDTLCVASCRYRRLKSNAFLGLPSDRPRWLLDVLDILKEEGAFEATDEELKEIQMQAEFETQREPGRDRRCRVGW